MFFSINLMSDYGVKNVGALIRKSGVLVTNNLPAPELRPR